MAKTLKELALQLLEQYQACQEALLSDMSQEAAMEGKPDTYEEDYRELIETVADYRREIDRLAKIGST